MTALSALAADRGIGAVMSKVTRLTAVTAGTLILAFAGNVTGLTTVAAHGSIRALTSNMTHLMAVVAHHISAGSGRTSLTTPSTYKFTTTSQGTRKPCDRADRTCSRHFRASDCH